MRTVLHVRRRTSTNQQAAAWEDAYYLSSQAADTRSPEHWLQTIRDHWAGVEIRNHWRKDACLFEDKTRSGNANLVGCLSLLRNLVLHFYVEHQSTYGSLPAFIEAVVACPAFAFSMIRAST